MSKELEALEKLRDLVEWLTRIDYVPTALRNEVKELLIKSYEDSEGYFSQIEEALKRNEPHKVEIRYSANEPKVRLEKQFCPECDEMIYDKTPNYCPHCGVKLGWSDDEIEKEKE